MMITHLRTAPRALSSQPAPLTMRASLRAVRVVYLMAADISQGEVGDCYYVMRRGKCNVYVDEKHVGLLQVLALQPVPLTAPHYARYGL